MSRFNINDMTTKWYDSVCLNVSSRCFCLICEPLLLNCNPRCHIDINTWIISCLIFHGANGFTQRRKFLYIKSNQHKTRVKVKFSAKPLALQNPIQRHVIPLPTPIQWDYNSIRTKIKVVGKWATPWHINFHIHIYHGIRANILRSLSLFISIWEWNMKMDFDSISNLIQGITIIMIILQKHWL